MFFIIKKKIPCGKHKMERINLLNSYIKKNY